MEDRCKIANGGWFATDDKRVRSPLVILNVRHCLLDIDQTRPTELPRIISRKENSPLVIPEILWLRWFCCSKTVPHKIIRDPSSAVPRLAARNLQPKCLCQN